MSVFLSYSRTDRAYADLLLRSLEKRGVNAKADVNIPPGEEFSEAILNMIKASDAVIFLVPGDSGSSRHALYEIGAAKAMGKKIIALMPHGRQSSARDIVMSVADFILIDVANKKPDEVAALVDRILQAETAR